jgi:hypothetical protein
MELLLHANSAPIIVFRLIKTKEAKIMNICTCYLGLVGRPCCNKLSRLPFIFLLSFIRLHLAVTQRKLIKITLVTQVLTKKGYKVRNRFIQFVVDKFDMKWSRIILVFSKFKTLNQNELIFGPFYFKLKSSQF